MRIMKRLKTLRFLVLTGLLAGLGSQAAAETRVSRVYGGFTESWQTCMIAGDARTVELAGDGYTDLDLYVYDDNGNLIVSDTRYVDYGNATWVALRTSCFTVKVVNRGYVSNVYRLTIG